MPRRFLMGLLGFGVIAGYGSAFASMHHRGWHHHGCEARQSHWVPGHFEEEQRQSAPQTIVLPPTPAAAPAPAPVVSAAPAPQVFVIMAPGQAASTPAQVVMVPQPATVVQTPAAHTP